jgi:DnaJ family protein C protein 12
MEQILCEYKIRALSLHPDKNLNNGSFTEEKFIKLQKAKDVLSDSELRKCYDKWRLSGIAMTFEKWSHLGKDVHNSMHWIKRTKNELMIDCGPGLHSDFDCRKEQQFQKSSTVWKRETGDEMLKKFRNYEI